MVLNRPKEGWFKTTEKPGLLRSLFLRFFGPVGPFLERVLALKTTENPGFG